MKRLLFFLAGLVVAGSAAVWWFTGREEEAPIPDEKRVAMIELEDKQSGPGYFHAEADAQPDEQGIRWIAPDKAAAQIDRVIRERKLEEVEREKLARLIDEVSELHPSRTVGGSRVNVARLNVALDANANAR
ncbi:potassium-transporting ATPase subunit C [Luteolibacter arcticus]|uniref:Potassium-transporting ATPase subunit C n=1 Tax=Luteolibacter arcticus TaxID=1581411 RepID=A0ABT3GRU9_9BACT|nr:potassium-transporting ATPase subunit C [Luteolibacter arcticus]MCW1926254.1 potassium-transporting ATPase subunit C [Luteolibacter arcticus]